jgi:hypothetical protein
MKVLLVQLKSDILLLKTDILSQKLGADLGASIVIIGLWYKRDAMPAARRTVNEKSYENGVK